MSALLFILFIIAAAAVDSSPLAGVVCLEALVILCLLNKEGRRTSMGYKTCPYCGAHLDPGETCDCQDEIAMSQREEQSKGNNDDNNKKKEEKHDE